jgi:hypothetical protein
VHNDNFNILNYGPNHSSDRKRAARLNLDCSFVPVTPTSDALLYIKCCDVQLCLHLLHGEAPNQRVQKRFLTPLSTHLGPASSA